MTEDNSSAVDRPVSRRSVIMGAAAVAGAMGMSGLLPERLASAASVRKADEGFDLSQIKHVVYVMQENRSFDHYFGTFPGVRGFDDPTALKLSTGRSVFQQPDTSNPDGYLEPFHLDTEKTGAAAIPSLSHDWRDQHASWNKGAMDGWLATHIDADGDAKGAYTMGYMEQQDIPFHWALAENFTICDNYHCSVLGPTYPNRAVWMSGTNDPQGKQGGPILETVKPNTLTWTSAAEVLYDAGYTVKTYTSSGSYNYFSWWQSFVTKGNVDDALYNRVMMNGTLFGDGKGGVGNPLSPTTAQTSYLGFEEDCANGTLADVTWLFPDGPYASDEHPPNTPAAGAYFLASKLEALAASDLWDSTVFIINYDENDGFFDHVPPPSPSKSQYPEEFVTLASPKGTPGGGLPVGAGFRVPCLIVSPWTVGGHIYSQVSDHTSPLQLIEAVTAAGGLDATPTTQSSGRKPVTFGVISTWRRATFDDLAGVFQDAAVAAPQDNEFDQDTRQADYNAQLAASAQPMPTRPGAKQTMPHQDPPPSSGSGTTSQRASATPESGSRTEAAAARPIELNVPMSVPQGDTAYVALAGLTPATKVFVRTSRGTLVAQGGVPSTGRTDIAIPSAHVAPGKHRYTVAYTDSAGHAQTQNIEINVKAKHTR